MGEEPDVDQLDIMQAAFVSENAVREFIELGIQTVETSPTESASPPGHLYLRSITAQGFRGIAAETTLDLKPQPGLTIIQGANGSGKSSFAEAVEVVLTGTSYRWNDRDNSDFKDGFRNLHQPDTTQVTVALNQAGERVPLVLQRSWEAGASVDSSTFGATGLGVGASATLESLGLSSAVESFRPVLTNEELGRVHDRRKVDAYRQVEAILGLERYNTAAENIRTVRLAFNKEVTAAKSARAELVGLLADSESDLATQALLCVEEDRLDDLQNLVTSAGETEGDVRALQYVVAHQALTESDFTELIQGHQAAVEDLAEVSNTEAGAAADTQRLLQVAIDHHESHGDSPCPVCGEGQLDRAWLDQAQAEAARLAELAADYRSAEQRVQQTRGEIVAVSLLDLDQAAPALAGWEQLANLELALGRWAAATSGDELVIEAASEAFTRALSLQSEAQAWATKQLEEMRSEWAPIRHEIEAWSQLENRAVATRSYVKRLQDAENYVTTMVADLRSRRFEPIRDHSIAFWNQLRHESSVAIDDMNLSGKGNRGVLNIDVNVDGVETSALAVMSQGELNCLALSLFLPRATHSDSPFQFVVIDDPIQAMDPSKVDGLATVLQMAAQTHQVIVFTHDPRLSAAIARLGIAGEVIDVSRSAQSEVIISESLGHVRRQFQNARDVSMSDNLDDNLKRRVVAGYCSRGIEAACAEKIIRTKLQNGESHSDAQAAADDATTLIKLMAVAIFDDEGRAGDVFGTVNGWGASLADAVRACKEGGHAAYTGDLHSLVADSQSVAERIRL